MSQDKNSLHRRMSRFSAPVALFTLLSFTSSLAPRQALAAGSPTAPAGSDPVTPAAQDPATPAAPDIGSPPVSGGKDNPVADADNRRDLGSPPVPGGKREPTDPSATQEDTTSSAAANLQPKEDADKLQLAAKPVHELPLVTSPSTTSLPTGENKTGVGAQAISVPKGPGTIEGMGESFSAQASTGISTFSIPISLPAARGDAQPSLGLSYSSASGSGPAGVGWSVGVPFIARQTDRGLPSYDDESTWHSAQDRFVYNGGQELVPITDLLDGESLPTWAGAGWQYFRPRVEGSYLRFFWNPSQRVWRVQDKGGVILELGAVGGETDALETDPSDSTKVFRWNLKRQLDPHGNAVWYSYAKFGNQAYLTDIYDTFPSRITDPSTSTSADTEGAAHHTRLVYETRQDVSTSYRRGWKTTSDRRLARVDVTAKGEDAGAARLLVRRYRLSYVAGSYMSLLDSVQVEGRCEPDLTEASGQVPNNACASLPAMKLGYTHVATGGSGQPSFDDGFEVLDRTVRSMTGSPKHSVDEEYTDLYDVNSDGLPDVVTMMPGLYGGDHGLWLQGKGGTADRFGAQEPMAVWGVLGATASTISKHNANIAALDVDADATIDLVHMPKVKTYAVYTPEYHGKWGWKGRSVTTSDQNDARIDLGNDASELRVFDVNGDGLVDVVKTAGTALEVWYSLGRYPGGDGLFGTGRWTGPKTAVLSMAPVMRCVPHSSTPVRFSDPDIKLGDMNGDGLTDIVRIRKGDIRYWPGRGDGTFGTGPLGCAGGTFSTNSYIQMSESPYYTDPDGSGLRLNDVNGDGTSDLVQVRFQNVDVWYNVGGASWQDRRVINNTPASPSYQQRVRLVDINGSGTPDILWGDGLSYKYIDLAGGKRPWLLNRVENGLGKTTEVSYTTSTAAMLAAAAAGEEWQKLCPTVLHMVDKVTVLDNLGTVGRPNGVYTTEYIYRDPVFDGMQREFRGFSDTTVRTVGDANSPTSESRTEFLLGENPSTVKADRWKDNPNEALKGLPTVAETYDPATGVYLSTTGTSYTLRKLYEGNDGRGVYVAFAKQTDGWLYDTAGFAKTESPGDTEVDPALTQTDDQVIEAGVTVRAQSGTKHTRSVVMVDGFGNRTSAIAYGVLGEDEAITSVTTPVPTPTPLHVMGEGNWAWRTGQSWVVGSDPNAKRNWSETDYEGHGDPVEVRVHVDGGIDNEVDFRRADGGAPMPPHVANGTSITTSKTRYDDFGNSIFTWAAGDRCARVEYDDHHTQLPIREHVYVGGEGEVTVGGESFSCGDSDLQAEAEYDYALQAVVKVTDVNAGVTEVEYDTFGRMTVMYAPNPDVPFTATPVPSLMVEYHLATPDHPVSMLVSKTQDGATYAATGDENYHWSYAYVDGLGRTIATLSEADVADDGFAWVVEGLTDYDLKGAERRKYLAWTYDKHPTTYNLAVASPAKYGQQRYDAFGRAVETQGLDGTVTLMTRYHALSADAWDAEDIGPGPHQGTYASEEKDGHGRVKRTTERVHVLGDIEARHVEMTYLPTGEPLTITRRRGADTYTRTMQYDSLGRMTVNLEPTGGVNGWRYLYDQAGDLAATSDPRGCGVNFAYDRGGRLLSEDYSPCESHQGGYTSQAEVVYEYDDWGSAEASTAFSDPVDPNYVPGQNCRLTNYTLGRLVAVTDRAQRSITCYDGRGRTVEVAKQLKDPSGNLAGRWYNRRAKYDGADRPVVESTGAQLLVGGQISQVETSYTDRGKVDQVSSSYGMLVDHVTRDADGLVKEIQYGDAADTTTGFTYDDLRRLRNLTTFRSNQSGWTNGEHTQQMLLQDEQFTYDRVGNPVEVRDWRDPEEWPAGAKPVTRKMQYDDLYRLARIDYQQVGGEDPWKDPYAAEVFDNTGTRPQPSPRADFSAEPGGKRVQWQTYAYDWLGNTTSTDDDQHAFYDRSLGTVGNGTTKRYQLDGANNTGSSGTRNGSLSATYDDAGNLLTMDVSRDGACTVPGGCANQHFEYQWDEVGRLTRAQRWDKTVPDGTADADLSFTYDASDQRVRKTSGSSHTLYVFGSLELRRAAYEAGDYVLSETTEVPYLFANGVRLGRVVHDVPPDDYAGQSSTRVFLELGDHLGSTSVVLDLKSGELVQRSTAYAYGEVESSLRPGRWEEFREDYRFTGKEDDVEVGLIYFGKRFYAPLLQRWISPDPLAIHAPGQADLNLYAYVHGRALIAVDPVGLAVRNVQADYDQQRAAYQEHRTQASNAAATAYDTYSALQSAQAGMTAAGRFGEAGALTPDIQTAYDAYVQNTRIVGELDRNWSRRELAFKALLAPVPSWVQGSEAVREYRREQMNEFDAACDSMRQSLAASVAVLGYTLVQEGRNGRLDAKDHHNIRIIGITVAGVTAMAAIAATAKKRFSGRYADGQKAYRTNVPRDPKTNVPSPLPEAKGPHSRLQPDAVDSGRTYSATEFDANGQPVRRVDFAARTGQDLPHQHPYNPSTKGFGDKQPLDD
jgi:RHS repeat-associated protein